MLYSGFSVYFNIECFSCASDSAGLLIVREMEVTEQSAVLLSVDPKHHEVFSFLSAFHLLLLFSMHWETTPAECILEL